MLFNAECTILVDCRYKASVEGLTVCPRKTEHNIHSSLNSEEQASADHAPLPSTPADVVWACNLSDGSTIHAHHVIVATGGLSFPKVGTDGTGHRILAKLGHTLHEVYPALTPLTGPHPGGQQLAGDNGRQGGLTQSDDCLLYNEGTSKICTTVNIYRHAVSAYA